MHSAADLIRDLTEALIEASPGQRSPVMDRALSWLARHGEREKRATLQTHLPRSVKFKPCNTCGDDIFFAVRYGVVQPSGKHIWVPMCPYPIDTPEIVLDACTIVHEGGVPLATPSIGGRQYLLHSALCGLDEEPIDPDVAQIWYYTTGSRRLDAIDAVGGLEQILKDTG